MPLVLFESGQRRSQNAAILNENKTTTTTTNNNNNNTKADGYGAVIMAKSLREFTHECRTEPGGRRPLDQDNRLEPEIRLTGSYSIYMHVTIYYFSARKPILILPSHGG